MHSLLNKLNSLVWGIPTISLILGTGLYFTAKTGFCQFTRFPYAIRSFFEKLKPDKNQSGNVSPYQALCTALAATVGTGNIAGVAGAMGAALFSAVILLPHSVQNTESSAISLLQIGQIIVIISFFIFNVIKLILLALCK